MSSEPSFLVPLLEHPCNHNDYSYKCLRNVAVIYELIPAITSFSRFLLALALKHFLIGSLKNCMLLHFSTFINRLLVIFSLEFFFEYESCRFIRKLNSAFTIPPKFIETFNSLARLTSSSTVTEARICTVLPRSSLFSPF